MPKRHRIPVAAEGDGQQPPTPAAESPSAGAPSERRERRLSEQLAAAEEQVKELNDKYLRALADLDNVRRRARNERAGAVRDGESAILLEVMPVLDNFARAMAAAQESNDAKALMDGVRMAYEQLHQALGRKGVHAIVAEGKVFDPLYHEAVGRVETCEQKDGTVAVEVQKGYMLGDRVLRPSRVLVAAEPRGEGQSAGDAVCEER